MYPAPPGWARAPFLLVNQNFDHRAFDGGGPAPTANSGPIFSTSTDQSWQMQATGAGSSVDNLTGGTPYHIGEFTVATGTTSGNLVAIGIDTQQASLAAPGAIALAPHIYRWDWWINLPSVASIDVFAGLMNALSPTLYAIINVDTNVDGNWHVRTANGGAETNVNSGIAATTGYHKFTGIQAPLSGVMTWHFYVDDVLVGQSSSDLPVGPITVMSRVRTRTAAAKTIIIDHCQVWTDGAAMVIGGSP